MALEDAMPAFARLSYGERWKVILALRRGHAPRSGGQAAAAIEYADSVDRARWARIRLFVLVVALLALATGIYAASRGSVLSAVAQLLFFAVSMISLLTLPNYWPRAMDRCVSQSRAMTQRADDRTKP